MSCNATHETPRGVGSVVGTLKPATNPSCVSVVRARSRTSGRSPRWCQCRDCRFSKKKCGLGPGRRRARALIDRGVLRFSSLAAAPPPPPAESRSRTPGPEGRILRLGQVPHAAYVIVEGPMLGQGRPVRIPPHVSLHLRSRILRRSRTCELARCNGYFKNLRKMRESRVLSHDSGPGELPIILSGHRSALGPRTDELRP